MNDIGDKVWRLSESLPEQERKEIQKAYFTCFALNNPVGIANLANLVSAEGGMLDQIAIEAGHPFRGRLNGLDFDESFKKKIDWLYNFLPNQQDTLHAFRKTRNDVVHNLPKEQPSKTEVEVAFNQFLAFYQWFHESCQYARCRVAKIYGFSRTDRYAVDDKIFDYYTIEEYLGGDEYNQVYRVHTDDMPEHPYALKLVLKADEFSRSTLENEISTRRLFNNHPNIGGFVFTHTISSELRLLVLEYIHGATLKIWIDAHSFTWGNARLLLEFVKQTLNGLAFIHSRGYVHGGIRPRSLVINDSGVVKITDFGNCGRSGTAGLMTPDSQRYLPEEELAKGRQFSHDTYALGALLHEYVFGIMPGESLSNLLPDEKHGLRKRQTEVSDKWFDFIMTACSEVQEDRFQNASDMLTALEKMERAKPSISKEKK